MAKLFKIQAYIIDYGDEFCNNEYLKDYLVQCTKHDLNLKHLKTQSVELGEWDDNHPLNYVDCPESEYEKYFKENNTEDSPSFTCSLCGRTILTEFVVHEDGTIEIKRENAQVRGGLGNRILYDNVCSQCIKKMSCFNNDKFLAIIDELKNNIQPIISQNNTEVGLK